MSSSFYKVDYCIFTGFQKATKILELTVNYSEIQFFYGSLCLYVFHLKMLGQQSHDAIGGNNFANLVLGVFQVTNRKPCIWKQRLRFILYCCVQQTRHPPWGSLDLHQKYIILKSYPFPVGAAMQKRCALYPTGGGRSRSSLARNLGLSSVEKDTREYMAGVHNPVALTLHGL